MKTKMAPLVALPPRASAALPPGTVALMPEGCTPRDGTTGVAPVTTLRVCAFDQAAPASDWEWQSVTLDGVSVTGAYGSPARLATTSSSGRSYLLVTPFKPFEASSTHVLKCVYKNTAGPGEIAYVSTFTVSSGETYTGTSPNYFERILMQPCTTLLEVEPLRNILLGLALTNSKYGGTQDTARAARVLYQIAQNSDAASLLNAYGPYDAAAMASDVAGRRTRFQILNALRPYERRVQNALAALVEGGPVPPALAPALVDGCDSALYTHKIGTICVIPFLARAIEEASIG